MGEHDPLDADPAYHEALAALERLAQFGAPTRVPQRAPAQSPTTVLPAADGRAEAAARRPWSESTFRLLLEALPDAVVVIDARGDIVLVNEQTERMFHYRRDELLGRPIELLIPERFRLGHVAHREAYFANLRRRPMGAGLDLFGRRRDGTEFAVEISLSPLQTEQGPLATSVIRDISQRKRDEAKFRTLVENIPAVTFFAPLDQSAPELYVSPQIEELLGFSQKEWLEDPVLWYRQLHPDDRERWNGQFAPTCARGASFREVYRFLAKDGRAVWIHGSAQVVRDADGTPSFLQGVAFDITSIKEAEEERGRFFALALDLLCVVGLTGALKRVNPAFTATLGFSTAELLGAPLLDYVHPEDHAATQTQLVKLAHGAEAVHFENRCRCKDGSYRWLQWAATPYLAQQVIYAAARDVTGAKRDAEALHEQARLAFLRADVSSAATRSGDLQEMLQRCATALTRHLPVALARIWTFNEKASLLELQASAGLITHRDGPQRRLPLGQSRIGQIAVRRQALYAHAVAGEDLVDDQEWARREGLIAFAGYPLLIENRLVGVLAAFARTPLSSAALQSLELAAAQISLGVERKAAEDTLRQINAELEWRVQERTEALARSMAQLQAKTDELEQFAYVASHDLREPLRTLVNWPQRLAREYAGQLDEQANNWLGRIISGARRMHQFIDDLSQYARALRGDLVLTPTDCTMVVREACANLQAALEESGAALTLGELPVVLGNHQQLMLLFQNLIGNALKFRAGERPGRIGVGGRRDGDSWLLWVRDNGIGIEAKYLRRIFGLGERLHSASKYAGTGFGLAICEKIVARHGGRLWAESEPGEGSTFFFTLPAAAPAPSLVD